jgi:hypothetical protein
MRYRYGYSVGKVGCGSARVTANPQSNTVEDVAQLKLQQYTGMTCYCFRLHESSQLLRGSRPDNSIASENSSQLGNMLNNEIKKP